MQASPNEEPGGLEALMEAFQQASREGNPAEVERLSTELMRRLSEEAAEEPDEDLRLKLEAHEHESRAEWDNAEACYRRGLELAEAAGEECALFKAHYDLSSLYHLLDRHEESLERARSAVEIARTTDLIPLLAMGLESLATSLIQSGDLPGALSAAEEVVTLSGSDPAFRLHRARGLVLCARSRAEAEPKTAEKHLKAAWELLSPYSESTLLAGYQSALASWWEATSRIRRTRGDLAGAAEAMGRTVQFRRTVSQAPQLAGPYKYNTLAVALHRYRAALLAAGDEVGATEARLEARRIRLGIGLPELQG